MDKRPIVTNITWAVFQFGIWTLFFVAYTVASAQIPPVREALHSAYFLMGGVVALFFRELWAFADPKNWKTDERPYSYPRGVLKIDNTNLEVIAYLKGNGDLKIGLNKGAYQVFDAAIIGASRDIGDVELQDINMSYSPVIRMLESYKFEEYFPDIA